MLEGKMEKYATTKEFSYKLGTYRDVDAAFVICVCVN